MLVLLNLGNSPKWCSPPRSILLNKYFSSGNVNLDFKKNKEHTNYIFEFKKAFLWVLETSQHGCYLYKHGRACLGVKLSSHCLEMGAILSDILIWPIVTNLFYGPDRLLKRHKRVLFKFRDFIIIRSPFFKVKIKCGLLWGHNHFSLLVPLTLMRSRLICSKHRCNGINRKWKSSYSGRGASWMHNVNVQRLYNPFGPVAEPFPTLRAAFLIPRVNEAAG